MSRGTPGRPEYVTSSYSSSRHVRAKPARAVLNSVTGPTDGEAAYARARRRTRKVTTRYMGGIIPPAR